MKEKTAQALQPGHDERNLARLSLILANKRVPDALKQWVKEFPSPDTVGVSMRIECVAGHNNVVPHGIDNDILLGLINGFVDDGMPEDGVIRLTAYRLLQLSAINTSGKRYASLEESLSRLQSATYKITDSWFDNNRAKYRTVKTSLVQKYVIMDEDERIENLKEVRSESVLEITLDSDLTGSIRSGFIRHLDLSFLRQLQQPLTRLLYRLLSEQRHPFEGSPALSYQVNIMAWAKHLGLLDDRAFRVRRALEPAHQQLLDMGFLSSVDYVGRGEAQDIQYVFAENAPPLAEPQAVALLVQYGVSQDAAHKLAASYGRQAIEARVEQFEALLATGYQVHKKASLLIDLVKNPKKYQVSETALIAPAKGKTPRKATGSLLTVEPESEDAKGGRTPTGAKFLIGTAQLTDLDRAEAVDLYVSGLVTALELQSLQKDPEPRRTVLLWGARRHRSGTRKV